MVSPGCALDCVVTSDYGETTLQGIFELDRTPALDHIELSRRDTRQLRWRQADDVQHRLRNVENWRRVAGSLHSARLEIVDAIAQRDSTRAVQLVRDYHRKVIKRTRSAPKATTLSEAYRGFANHLSSWLEANAGIGGRRDRKD
jgi:hypothetical protein